MSDLPKRFDLTVNLGHVIIVFGALVGFVASNYRSDYQMAALEKQVASLQVKLDGFTSLLVDAAVARAELRSLERRMDVVERR